MAAPFDNMTYLTAAITEGMTEFYLPGIEQIYRWNHDILKFFNLRKVQFPAGNKKLHIRVEEEAPHNARYVGDTAHGSFTLPETKNTWEYEKWEIGPEDLRAIATPQSFDWKSNQVIGDKDVGPLAYRMARNAVLDTQNRKAIGLVTQQSGLLAEVMGIGDTTDSYSNANTTADGTTTAKIWFKNGSPHTFMPGMKLDLVDSGGALEQNSQSQNCDDITVTDVEYADEASTVYGAIVVDMSTSTADDLYGTATGTYLLLSDEYKSSTSPDATPAGYTAATSTDFKGAYGLVDWFKGPADTPGTIYNLARSSLGWTMPTILNNGGSAITLEKVDELLIRCSQFHVNSPKLPPYLLLGGVRTCHELAKETQSANRIMDGAHPITQELLTNYNFNGVVIRNVMMNGGAAIQPVRGLPENVVYAILPGEAEFIQLGDIAPVPVNLPSGDIWRRRQTSAGSETTTFYAVWLLHNNTLFKVPKRCGAVINAPAD